ncbi:MAG: DUF86 domain-containing protein [Opitutaceae bacterium]|nr:DUF86 domain-containing protein [Opitutaceae bacterium]
MKDRRVFSDYLRDIVQHADAAMEFVAGMGNPAALAQDQRTFMAVIRALEVIGEAARKVPPELRARYPEIPWRGMTGMRDKVIHDYFGVDASVVWRTVREELPRMRGAVQRMLKELETEESRS